MITAVVPISPIPSHPDTTILAETILSIRHHLPIAEIFLTFDGVRPEQEQRRGDYENHIQKTLWLADKLWRNTVPYVFDEHLHQTGMLRAVLPHIRTPLLLYVEQDTPLVCDEPIDWQAITAAVLGGTSNCVRLHHEAVIPADHHYLIHGPEPDLPLLRTSQWSQRPHIASIAYYRRVLDAHFSEHAKCFIEDRMHSVVQQAFQQDDLNGWLQHRLHIYNPGPNMKRSYHTDGRAGTPKYDGNQIW